jgi:hypothetical protein
MLMGDEGEADNACRRRSGEADERQGPRSEHDVDSDGDGDFDGDGIGDGNKQYSPSKAARAVGPSTRGESASIADHTAGTT